MSQWPCTNIISRPIYACAELEVSKKQAESDKKKIEELTRERDLLSKVNTIFLLTQVYPLSLSVVCFLSALNCPLMKFSGLCLGYRGRSPTAVQA